eukprot:s251_g32.t1
MCYYSSFQTSIWAKPLQAQQSDRLLPGPRYEVSHWRMCSINNQDVFCFICCHTKNSLLWKPYKIIAADTPCGTLGSCKVDAEMQLEVFKNGSGLQHIIFQFAPLEGGICHFFILFIRSKGQLFNFQLVLHRHSRRTMGTQHTCGKLLCGTSCFLDTSFQIRRRSQRYCLWMFVS